MKGLALDEIQKRIKDEDRAFLERLDTAPRQKSLGDAVREVIRMSERGKISSSVLYVTAGVCFICKAKIPLPEPIGRKLTFTDVLCEACNKSVW